MGLTLATRLCFYVRTVLPIPPGRPTVRPIDRPTDRPTGRCQRTLVLPVPGLPLSLGGLAAVGCVWVWAGVVLLRLLLLLLLLLLWLLLLPELLMLPLLPLALLLLPGWCFRCGSPRGCLLCVRAKMRPSGRAKVPTRNQRKSA